VRMKEKARSRPSPTRWIDAAGRFGGIGVNFHEMEGKGEKCKEAAARQLISIF